MRLGILGGTFDPIHNGHLAMGHSAREALSLDKVLFVPAGQPPHKETTTAAVHRARMVELAIADQPGFEISKVDLERPGPHYSNDTIQILQTAYRISAEESFFIIGADSLMALPDWHDPVQLLQSCYLAVIHRPGYQPDLLHLSTILPDLPQRVIWVPMPSRDVSATELRRQIALCQVEAKDQIPAAVWDYIMEMQLYCLA